MFQVNDVIIYGAQGVCQIAGTEDKTVGGAKKTYFILKPVNDKGATIFAPTDNAHVLKKMRRLLSKDEINKLIDSMPDENALWVSNENEHLELIRMIKAIHAHKTAREAEGKRLHVSDERFFKDAEQILYNEFQYVLDIHSKDDLLRYITQRIGKQ